MCLGKMEHSTRAPNQVLSSDETPFFSDDFAVIESFVVSLYSVYCTLTDVNQARQLIFAQTFRTFEYLPPTKAALIEQVKLTTYQSAYVWGQSIIAKQD